MQIKLADLQAQIASLHHQAKMGELATADNKKKADIIGNLSAFKITALKDRETAQKIIENMDQRLHVAQDRIKDLEKQLELSVSDPACLMK